MNEQKTTQKDYSKNRPHNLRGGRPAMFPDAEIEKRMVTLPSEVWRHIETLNSSISLAVFQIADKDMKRKAKREKKLLTE